MTRVELKVLRKRAVASVVMEAATEWRLLTDREVRDARLYTYSPKTLKGELSPAHPSPSPDMAHLMYTALPMILCDPRA